TLPQRARRRIYGLRAVSSKQYLAENNFFDSLRGRLNLSRPFEFVIFVIKFSDRPKNAQPKPRIKTHDSN
ncbi:MAG: hypothetical protein EGR16_04975, partial [Clostridiales bacterium]|nr:hypothetical protein [Clostridiales bacterium]